MKRLLGAVALTAGLSAVALPASAHVTVGSSDATPGGYGVVAVRVPTESDTASTTKLVLQLPTRTPLLSVAVQPTAGWSDATTTARLAAPAKDDDGDSVDSAISTVTWTATAGGIKPGHFQQFFLSVGPFPKSSTVTFKAIQYYSDGSVVRWIETPAPGSSAEPEHPAPVLRLTSPAGSSADQPSVTAAARSDGGGSGDSGALVLAIVALVVAVGGAAFGVVSRARARGGA